MIIHEILKKNLEVWDLFTRQEEYQSSLRDMYDRFPHYASKNHDIFNPKASQYLVDSGYSIEYPDEAPFAVCLTHDIDSVYKSISSKGFSALRHLKEGNPIGSFNSLSWILSKKLPLCNFTEIMNLEEKYDAKSTFFIMAENPGEQDYSYCVEDLESEIGDILDNKWEIGLHGGHTTYLSALEMKNKKERLENVTHRSILGYRNHYLRFRVPDTWEFLSQAGFKYDATLGYADCVGFRDGMCHPYKPFNLNTKTEINIVEIPLTLMDSTLGLTYMRLNQVSSWDYIQMLIDRVANCHGVFTLLWHNTYMQGENYQLYEKILRYCKDRKAWMTTGSNICSLMAKHELY